MFFWCAEMEDGDENFTVNFNLKGFEAFSSSQFSLGIVSAVVPWNGNKILLGF